MAEPLQVNRDYTIDAQGRCIFTAQFLLARGECCGSGCQNCPYTQTVKADLSKGNAGAEAKKPNARQK